MNVHAPEEDRDLGLVLVKFLVPLLLDNFGASPELGSERELKYVPRNAQRSFGECFDVRDPPVEVRAGVGDIGSLGRPDFHVDERVAQVRIRLQRIDRELRVNSERVVDVTGTVDGAAQSDSFG